MLASGYAFSSLWPASWFFWALMLVAADAIRRMMI
jgi:hypothetical protein